MFPSQRQYKRKIAAWHLDKNIKDEEMRVMLWLQKQRKTVEGKDSQFYVRGRRVDPSKMARYARRKNTIGRVESRLRSKSRSQCSRGRSLLSKLTIT